MILFDMVLMPFSEWIEKLPLPSVRRFEKARDFLDKLIYGIIAERRAVKRIRGDLLSMLLLAQDEDGQCGMTDKQIRDEALTLFLAGHETTANALMWTWYLLSENPIAAAKFYDEVDRVLQGRLPAFGRSSAAQIHRKRVRRRHASLSPAWVVGRRVKTEYAIGDYTVPMRRDINDESLGGASRPSLVPEPDRFNPDRWLDPDDRPKFSYFPFGGGTRVCIGERFAWMEGVLLLATWRKSGASSWCPAIPSRPPR